MEVLYQHKERLLEGIKHSNKDVLRTIYKDYFPSISKYISENSGSQEDAKKVFQEAILIIHRKLLNSTLDLTGSLKNYLQQTCKLLWLQKLEKSGNDVSQLSSDLKSGVDFIDDILDLQLENERYRIYWDHFNQLEEDSRKLLRLFYDQVPIKQITEIMGFSSEDEAIRKKLQCKEALVRRIKNDSKIRNTI